MAQLNWPAFWEFRRCGNLHMEILTTSGFAPRHSHVSPQCCLNNTVSDTVNKHWPFLCRAAKGHQRKCDISTCSRLLLWKSPLTSLLPGLHSWSQPACVSTDWEMFKHDLHTHTRVAGWSFYLGNWWISSFFLSYEIHTSKSSAGFLFRLLEYIWTNEHHCRGDGPGSNSKGLVLERKEKK